MQNSFKFSIIIVLSCICFGVKSQEVLPSSGGDATGSGGEISYSVGQVFVQTSYNSNESILEGVQQPYEISEISNLEKAESINLELSAYPNPASNYLLLQVNNIEFAGLSYRLYNINGELISDGNVLSNTTSIQLETLQPATYFLKITRGTKEIKTFKIIKK